MIQQEFSKIGDHVFKMEQSAAEIERITHYAPEEIKGEITTALEQINQGLLNLSVSFGNYYVEHENEII